MLFKKIFPSGKTYSKFFLKILKYVAKFVIWRFEPKIIAVTGSVGKTSAVEAISAVLSYQDENSEKRIRKIRKSKGIIDSLYEVPLTIMGEWNEENLILFKKEKLSAKEKLEKANFLLKAILKTLYEIFVIKQTDYPEILILECGSRRPKDMKYILKVIRPSIGIITAVGEIPAHVEFWSGPEAVLREKARLVEHLPGNGFAVLNFDDEPVANLKDRMRGRNITFGFGDGADVKISNFENRSDQGEPWGISFKLSYGGSLVPIMIKNGLGRAEAYAAAIGACAGLIFDLNLVEISEALRANYKPIAGGMNLLRGIKDTRIINSSASATPLSVEEALNILRDFQSSRKIAVLGDMLELGKYTIEAHESIGQLAARIADIVITVGPRGKFIASGALTAGMFKNKISSFDTVFEAGKFLQETMRKGDLILIKASRRMELSKIVEEIREVR